MRRTDSTRKMAVTQVVAQLVKLSHTQRTTQIMGLLFGLLSTGFAMSQPILTGRLVSSISQSETTQGTTKLMVVLSVTLVASVLVAMAASYLAARFAEDVAKEQRNRLISASLAESAAQQRLFDQAELSNRMSIDTDTVSKSVIETTIYLPADILMIIGCVIGLFCTDPLSLLVIGLFMCLGLALSSYSAKRIARESTHRQAQLDECVEIGTDILRCATLLRNYQREQQALQRYGFANALLRNKGLRIGVISAYTQPLAGGLLKLGLIVVLALAAIRVSNGSLSLSTLTTFTLFLTYILTPVSAVALTVSNLGKVSAALERLSQAALITSPKTTVRIRTAETHDSGPLLALNGIDFSYGDGKPVLKSLDLEVPRRGITLVKGKSGAGKSTLLSIIAATSSPSGGSIEVATELADSYGNWVGPDRLLLVPQDYPQWGRSVRETITLSADISDDAIIDTLRMVGLDDWYRCLPEGLDTRLSALECKASGGELKRLGIARALVSNPRVLVLDEPTSNLDFQTATKLVAFIAELSKTITILIVTHDPSIWPASPTFELSRGKLTECTT